MNKDENFLKRLGSNVKDLRVKKGLTIKDLSHLTNLTESELERIEKGPVKVDLTTVITIAEVLGVDAIYLFEH